MANDDIKSENPLDDINDIDIDLNSLYDKYILPIESIRSRSAVNITGGIQEKPENDDNSILSTSTEPQESRAHTFYRSLGLPVVSDKGFYNPGFNPKATIEQYKSNRNIATSINENIKYMQSFREMEAKFRKNVFKNAGADSAVYSVVLSSGICQKSFNLFDKKVGPLDIDNQTASISQRQIFINTFYKSYDGYDILNTFDNVSHILRPFTTDPTICSFISPRSYEICVPFALKDEDRSLEKNVKLKRPGIEFILRLRLRQKTVFYEQSNVLATVDLGSSTSDAALNQGQSGTITNRSEIINNFNNLDLNNILLIAAAIQDKDSAGLDDISKALEGTLYIELYTLNDLVRTLKALVKLYINSLESISRIMNEICWLPLASEKGPEGGTKITTGFIFPKIVNGDWELERSIARLQVKSNLSKRQMEMGDKINFSDFVSSEFNNISNTYDEELDKAKQQKKNLEAEASQALKAIELITGEISGLGLIDIIAIWIALWSLDINVLLSLIDNESADRLSKIPELQTSEVIARKQNGPFYNINEALKKLDNRIVSILSYADRIFDLIQRPDEEGGDIPRG